MLIRDHYFSPQGITVALGDTVEWLNIGLIPHFTTSAAAPCSSSGLWSFRLWNGESGTIVLGEGALDTTGILSYYCDNHCNRAMTGTILVEP